MKPEELRDTRPRQDPASAPPGEAARRVAVASLRGVSKRFGSAGVLEDINLDIAEGEALVLLGASGSGKTTILRIIAGLERPDTGRIHLHGTDVTELPARERGVGLIFQSYALFPHMTVEQNIGYGLRIRRRPRGEVREAVGRLLDLVHLEEHRKKIPAQLSGGQQQRVAIARALAYQPRILLFDEPFGALDTQTRVRLRREIRSLVKEVNVSALFITHDQEEALEIGDRIAVLNAGRLEQVGTPYEVYNRPATEYVATFLGAANLLLGVVRRGAVEIGMAALPVGAQAEKFRDGQSAKLVFRPEDVALSPTGRLPDGCRRLCNGTIEEVHFVGAYERLRLRLDLGAWHRAEGAAPSPTAAGHSAEPGGSISIIVTRPKTEAVATRFSVGERVAVGLMSFSVLPNYTLATERGGRAVDQSTEA